MMTLKQGLRFLRHCGTVGAAEALRRYREQQDDVRIRKTLDRACSLTPQERKIQEKAARDGEIRFHPVFLHKEVPESVRAEALRSLREQTWQAAKDETCEPGDYTVFLEPDGFLHPGALYECAKAVQNTGAEVLYADEDYFIRTPGDLSAPYFKPDYGVDSLRGCNTAGPFLVCRTELLKQAGFENFAELDEDSRWDATLLLSGKANRVCHIPGILYYRRVPSEAEIPQPKTRRVKDPIGEESLVSILIPNKDHREDLKRCVDSILAKSTYPRYEIIIIENNSTEEETFRYYDELKKEPRIRVISYEGAFNYSAVNNFGFREANGEQILLLNNDTEVISGDWIQEMLMYAQRPDVGAVGAKLYYPDGTIQHAGIGIGIAIVAGHYHRGFPGDSEGYFGRLCYAQDVSAVTAACMMIPRRVYEEMNGLDEEYSIVFNDVDLCLRIREAGYLIVWTPQAELTHYESKSRGPELVTREKKRFFVKETNRFLKKWHSVLKAGDPYYNINLTRHREDFSPRG